MRMAPMKGVTIGQLATLYDHSSRDVQKWMLENSQYCWGKDLSEVDT